MHQRYTRRFNIVDRNSKAAELSQTHGKKTGEMVNVAPTYTEKTIRLGSLSP